jgi:WD40 repeat protein
VYSTGVDGVLRHWDAMTGRELRSFSAVGHGPVDLLDDGLVLVSNFWQGEAALLDFRAKGELGAVETCQGDVPANALGVADGLAAFLVRCADEPQGTTYVASLDDSEVLYTLPGHQADALAISPDGTRFVRQDGEGTLHGPLTVRDLGTGELLVELDGLCTWDAALPDDEQEGCREYPERPFGIRAELIRWSPDGSMIAAAVGAEMAVWDAAAGRLLLAEDVDPGRIFAADAIFTPDSRRLVVSGVPDGARVLSTVRGRTVDYIGVLDAEDDDGKYPSLLGYSPDGSTLLAVGGLHFIGAAGKLGWIDAKTFELVRTKAQIHDGHTVAAALSPDRTRIATGSSDGFVRIWDSDTGELLHEVPLDGVAVHGVAFVDQFHLAITPADGDLLIVTTDPDELLELNRASLTRGFRQTECERFNFGDNCPTLDELRGTSG